MDLDGDEDLDLVRSGHLLINDGTGTFFDGTALRVPSSTPPWAEFDAADFDGDGHSDIAIRTASQGTWILWNSGSGFFTEAQISGSGPGILTPTIALDLDGDGDTDLIAGGIYINQGDRSFSSESGTRLPAAFFLIPRIQAVGDLDQDGYPDLLDQFWLELRNDGNGVFEYTGAQLAPQGPLVDFDLDGDLDVLANPVAGPLLAGINDGSFHFEFEPLSVSSSSFSFLFADIDQDGDPDVLGSTFTLVNQHSQLAAPFKARPGFDYEVNVKFAGTNDSDPRLVGVLFGLASGRTPVFDWGNLLIEPATLIPLTGLHALAPGERMTSDVFSFPATFPTGSLFFSQGIIAYPDRVTFTNRIVDVVQ
ncbi:MAG: VCBS repeat-containing protein [Planctomycetes bacterium]|nr:VCBS repeat-containing protein [Planctomycetota bacterium]